MSYRPTKSDVACFLGYTLADAIRHPEAELMGCDIALLTEAFIDATIKAARPADRHIIRDVVADAETRNAWLAKAIAACEQKMRIVKAIAPDRLIAICSAAKVAA